jgi:hypothetical protein
MIEGLRVGDNKYQNHEQLTRRLANLTLNNNRTAVQDAIKNYDKLHNTNFFERMRAANIANIVGDRVQLPEGAEFALKNENNFFTGKGYRRPLDGLLGRTMASAGRIAEGAKPKRLSDLAQVDPKIMIYTTEGGLAAKEAKRPKKQWKSVADIK